MILNRPHINKRVYLGDGPLSVLSSCKNNLLEKTKFVNSKSLSTPMNHFFWSSFEYSLASVFETRFSDFQKQSPYYLSTDSIDIMLGNNPSMNILELMRKFPCLSRRITSAKFDHTQLSDQDITKELFDVWKEVTEFGSVESVNFNKVLNSNNSRLLKLLYSWVIEEYEKKMSESLRELIHALSLIFLGGNFKTFTPLQIFYLVSKLIAANYFFFSADGFAKEFLKNINVANPQVIFAPDLSASDSDMESGSKVKVGGYQGYLYTEKLSFGSLFFPAEEFTGAHLDYDLLRSSKSSFSGKKGISITTVKIKRLDTPEMMLEIQHQHSVLHFSNKNNKKDNNDENIADGEFYVLSARKTELSKISYSRTNPLGDFLENSGFLKEEVKLLENAHFLGIIAGLFYSD